ncbi:hypothetical protein ABK905_25965 [Acerihabitans sp. KWT182]|uniref:Molecular chaperone n=1 Tax=Acerihabitans sp. KWT182 TaxID=3157919 RepID=A0AAU7Q9H0_9GAMM
MKFLSAGRGMPALALAMLCPAPVIAGHSVLIWPVDPVITEESQGTELWVQNRGDATTLLQARIYSWNQAGGANTMPPSRIFRRFPA